MKTIWLTAAGAALWFGASPWQESTSESPQLRLPHMIRDTAPTRPESKTPAAPGTPEETGGATEGTNELVHAVTPKALSNTVRGGLEWLRANQHEDGGWSQGEEAPGMRAHGSQLVLGSNEQTASGPPTNVADTCVAALALLRSGSTPAEGPYATELLKAVGFVCSSVEAADEESLYVTDVRGTRVQGKIGTYVDTFLASMFLTEVQDEMPGEKAAERVSAALRKVLNKIETNQAQNGGFEGQGWAPVLSQGLAGKALNRASMLGFKVDAEVLASNDAFFVGQADVSADGAAAPGSAGIQLYGGAAKLGAQQEAVNNGYRREREVRDQLAQTGDADEKKELVAELDRIVAGRKAQEESQQAIVNRLGDEGFVAGFGNNGGEEFLSYMNISESLVVQADDTWRQWDKRITQNLANVQNEDGSWTGHHCITGRTFCTATALLTLMADRVEVPAELLANR